MTSHIALLKELMKSWNSFIAIDIWPLRGQEFSAPRAAKAAQAIYPQPASRSPAHFSRACPYRLACPEAEQILPMSTSADS